MTQNATCHPSLINLRRWTAASCVVAGTLLSSCGGQSNGTGNTAGVDSQNPGGNSTASLAISGAYQGTAAGNSSEFVGFVTPAQRLYVLYALQASDSNSYPILYTGSVQPLSATTAGVSDMTSFQYPNQLRLGSATVSGTSAAAYEMALSAGLSLAAPIGNPKFSANAIPTSSVAEGTWIGTWADGSDSPSVRINASVSLTGTPLTASASFGFCTGIALRLTPATDATTHPYFLAQAVIPGTNSTGCYWIKNAPASATLTGIGFIHASPASGKTKRLELILTDTTGSGISFRGDQ